MFKSRVAAIFIAVALLFAGKGYAQAARSGPTFNVGGASLPVDNVDVAYDPVNDRYLSVAQNGPGDTKFIEARLVTSAGGVVKSFTVNQSGVANVQSPRAAFSPHIAGTGGYLITWHQGVPFSMVRGRIFTAAGDPVTGDFNIGINAVSPATQSNWTMGAAVAYSPTSQEFLVAWMGSYGSTNDIFYARVDNVGNLLTSAGVVPELNRRITAGSADWERDPSVAYNPDQNVFYIAFGGYDEAGRYGYAGGQRVAAGSGSLVGGLQRFGAALSTYVPAVTYNTGSHQYLLGWYNRTSTFAAVYGVVLNGADASQVGDVRVLSRSYSAYDALDIDYNPPSGQYLLVTHGGGARDWEDAAVSILADGNPYDNGFSLTETTAGEGNFNPRMAASSASSQWLVVTSHRHASVFGQFATTGVVSTPPPPGPAPGPPPPQPPTAPATRLAVDSPVSGGTYAGRVLVQGWAADTAAGSGTGVDAVHVWAFPADGSPGIFIGATALGLARLDVGAFLGSSRFINSGYQVVARLAPGTYDIGVYAHSMVANTFNTVQVVRVVVTPPPSEPLMIVDLPAVNQTLSQNVLVSGWAIDKTADAGCGVDAVHVWAYPIVNGVYQSPIWVGAATVGVPRADVAASFGMGRLGSAGFVLSGALPRGDYDLVVFARSTVTGTFNNWRMVRIRIV